MEVCWPLSFCFCKIKKIKMPLILAAFSHFSFFFFPSKSLKNIAVIAETFLLLET